MGAMLLDLAVLKHHYEVCVLDGGQAVSDHDAGAALSGLVQGFLDNLMMNQNRNLKPLPSHQNTLPFIIHVYFYINGIIVISSFSYKNEFSH